MPPKIGGKQIKRPYLRDGSFYFMETRATLGYAQESSPSFYLPVITV